MIPTCPRCGNALSPYRFGTLQLDGCEGCGGVWFDYRELQTLTQDAQITLMDVERAVNPAVSAPETKGNNGCPKCTTALYGFSFPHTPDVKLDACPDCKGIWVDHDELQAIAARITDARPKPVETVSPAYDEIAREKARYATSFLLSSTCPSCGIHNPVSAVICWQCSQPIRTRKLFHLCPRCDVPLQEVSAESGPVRVDVCLKCSGIWFAEGELPALLRLGADEVNHLQRSISMSCQMVGRAGAMARCPGCHHGMESEQLGDGSGIDIDLCPYCQSVWMDAGELMAAYRFSSTGGSLRVSAPSDPWATGAD